MFLSPVLRPESGSLVFEAALPMLSDRGIEVPERQLNRLLNVRKTKLKGRVKLSSFAMRAGSGRLSACRGRAGMPPRQPFANQGCGCPTLPAR